MMFIIAISSALLYLINKLLRLRLHKLACVARVSFLYIINFIIIQEKEKWQSLLNNLPDAIAVVPVPKDQDKLRRLIFESKEFVNFTTATRMDSQGAVAFLQRGISNSINTSKNKSFTFQTDQGRYFVSSVRFLFGPQECVAFIVKDCSLLRSNDQQYLEEKYLKLVQASLNQQLQSPLNVIIGMVDMMKMEAPLPEALSEKIVILENMCDLITHFLRNVNDIVQHQIGDIVVNRGKFTIRNTIKHICSLFEYSFRQNNISLNAVIDNSVPDILIGDEMRYHQVAVTLIGNSLKFTKKGRVTISVTYNESDQILTSSVEDTGPGVNPADIPKLFMLYGHVEEPEGKTSSASGIGFGLTLSKILCKSMGGDIEYIPRETGCNFTFHIKVEKYAATQDSTIDFSTHPPLLMLKSDYSEDPKPQQPRFAKPTSVYLPKSLPSLKMIAKSEEFKHRCFCTKLLVIDHNAFNKQILGQYANQLNILWEDASSGEEAIKIMVRKTKGTCCHSFKLILVNMELSAVNGLDTLMRINEFVGRGLIPACTSIGYTGGTMIQKKEVYLKAGFKDILGLPLRLGHLQGLCEKYKLK